MRNLHLCTLLLYIAKQGDIRYKGVRNKGQRHATCTGLMPYRAWPLENVTVTCRITRMAEHIRKKGALTTMAPTMQQPCFCQLSMYLRLHLQNSHATTSSWLISASPFRTTTIHQCCQTPRWKLTVVLACCHPAEPRYTKHCKRDHRRRHKKAARPHWGRPRTSGCVASANRHHATVCDEVSKPAIRKAPISGMSASRDRGAPVMGFE